MATIQEIAKGYVAEIKAGEPASAIAANVRGLYLIESGASLSPAQNQQIIDEVKTQLAGASGVLIEKDNKYVMELIGLLQDLLKD